MPRCTGWRPTRWSVACSRCTTCTRCRCAPGCEHALAAAARKLGSHGRDAELLGIDDDGTVRVAVSAAGCGATTVREVVTDEVTAAAPDAAGLAFVERDPGPTLLQIGVRER